MMFDFNWQRYKKYWQARLAKLKGTLRSIAVGVACGAAISFTPFVGLHLVLAMVTAWIIRGNLMAAAIGTIVGNPWTFPFIWVSVLYTGRKILGQDYAASIHIDFPELFAKAGRALINFDFDLFFNDIWPILWPMMIGCLPYYVVVWALSYYGTLMLLKDRKRVSFR